MPSFDLGQSIPPDTAHAVSVSLPTWKSNVGYEEGEQWVLSRMTTGYPRFFVHRSIEALAEDIVRQFVPAEEPNDIAHGPGTAPRAMLFPTRDSAARCLAFIKAQAQTALPSAPQTPRSGDGTHHKQPGESDGPSPPRSLRPRIFTLVLDASQPEARQLAAFAPAVSISAVLCPDATALSSAKQYWQHTGDGVSSRRAEFCHSLLRQGLLTIPDGDDAARPSTPYSPGSPLPGEKPCRGPRRYQRPLSLDGAQPTPASPLSPGEDGPGPVGDVTTDMRESSRFLEERFGRNLDLAFIEMARSAIRRRIAGAFVADVDDSIDRGSGAAGSTGRVNGLREDDIYLYPCGMNAIFNAHRALLAARGAYKSVSLGFPYVDTLKILQKFGPGCVFYGRGSESDLDDLETRLQGGERFLALFCEFPGNPLLTCPNLERVRALADKFDFAVVVDETIGTFANIHVLPLADMVVSSLTKIFSGDCNVMGGSAILNPRGRHYASLKDVLDRQHSEGAYWAEDIIFMERNSRDFASRIDRINTNAEAICDELLRHQPALVKRVYYPKCNAEWRPNYDRCRLPSGGYGGLLSVTFRSLAQATAFYDAIQTAKGPSLGTNFTLTSPYVILAHYNELDWAAGLGVDPDLIRISVGLEETDHLIAIFRSALQAAATATATPSLPVAETK